MSVEIRPRSLAILALLAAGLVFAGRAEAPELTIINRSGTAVAIGPSIVVGACAEIRLTQVQVDESATTNEAAVRPPDIPATCR